MRPANVHANPSCPAGCPCEVARLLHGARHSPHDNPVERIWAALKAWLAKSPTLTIQGRVRQVHAFFRERSPAHLLATAAPHSSPWLPEDCVRTSGRPLSVGGWARRHTRRRRPAELAGPFPAPMVS